MRHTLANRLHAALLLGALGALPAAWAPAWVAARNPWFLDHPLSWLGLLLAPPALLGALAGLLLGGGWGQWTRIGAFIAFVAAFGVQRAVGRGLAAPPIAAELLVVGVQGLGAADLEAHGLIPLRELETRGLQVSFGWSEPTTAPAAWTTLLSGRNAGVHGIFADIPGPDPVRAARLWEIADWSGLRVGLLGWPLLAPVEDGQEGGFHYADDPRIPPIPAGLAAVHALEALIRTGQVDRRAPGPLVVEAVGQGLRWSTARDVLALVLEDRLRGPVSPDRPDRAGALITRLRRDIFLFRLQADRVDLGALFLDLAVDTADPSSRAAACHRLAQVVAELRARATPGTPLAVIGVPTPPQQDQGLLLTDAGQGRFAASPLDVLPTLLGLLDLPVARDMSGRALLGESGPRVPTWDALAVAGPAPGEEGEYQRESLRQAGYLE